MKKITTLGLSLVLLASLASCKSVPTDDVTIMLPNGTPTLALGSLLSECSSEVVSDASLLQTALVAKENRYDLVIAPLTAGTNLYLKGKSNYKVEAIITTNNTYLVSRGDDLFTKEAMEGKEIVAFQETNTPGIILKSYLEKNEINASENFMSNVNESVAVFNSSKASYAVVAEPQLTSLEAKYDDLNILNLGDEITEGDAFIPQAAIFVNPDVKDDEDVKEFLRKLEKNIERLNSESALYAKELKTSGILTFENYQEAVLATALPRCNLAYKKASDNKEHIENFYDLVDTYVNNMFAGVKPDEEFYN